MNTKQAPQSGKVAVSYLGEVVIPEGRSGSYAIEHFKIPANTRIETSSSRTSLFGGQENKPVVFDHETTWHRLKYSGGVWMTDLPIEQAQHRAALEQMEGDVLVGGLGLGLAANWLAKSPRVRSVTVVEISNHVVNLVGAHIRDPRGIVTVVRADLMRWLRTTRKQFDWAFYDIWQSDGEGTFFQTVVPLRRLSRGVVTNVVNWNEDVMRGQLAWSLRSRNMTLSLPGSGLTLAELAHPVDKSIWTRWSAPFFLAVERGAVNEGNFQEMASIYAGTYGMVGFEEYWRRLVKTAIAKAEGTVKV